MRLAALLLAIALSACEASTVDLAPILGEASDAGQGLDAGAISPDAGSDLDAAHCVYRDDDAGILPHHCP